MLLDGDLGLTERVPLELHVNTCAECRQRLADLQTIKVVEDGPAPRAVYHWPPVLAAGLVGRALGVIRTDDVASRLRRFVVERFPPRHLAVAAAVPLVVTLAIFVFERGFAVGTAMRQRPPTAPLAMRSSPPAATPPTAISTEPIIPTPRPLPPAPPAQSTSSPPPAARVQAPPQSTPPLERPKAVDTKVAQTKAAEGRNAAVSPKTGGSVKRDPTATPASSKPAPVKAVVAPTPPAAATSTGKDGPATARALPQKANGAPTDAVTATSRRGTVDVVGRLKVKNRNEAERDLAALLSRAGGTSVSQQRGPSVTVVDASVPHASYGKFAQGLVRIGAWQLEAERSPLPDLVQVSVRLAD